MPPKGWKLSEEVKNKMSGVNNPFFGKHHTNKSKQKMRNWWTKERRVAFSKAKKREVIAGVYGVFDTKTGRVYVGSSRNVLRRWKEQVQFLKGRYHSCASLQQDWNDHFEVFTFVLLEKQPITSSKSHLLRREEYWIDLFPEDWRYNGFSPGMPKAEKLRWQEPEYRKRKSLATAIQMKKLWARPDFQKKIRLKRKQMWADPKFRKRMQKVAKRKYEDVELRNRIGAATKERWQDPTIREKMLAGLQRARDTRWRKIT